MRTTYLVRKGTSWTFQIRLPRSLVKDSTLATIRVPIGSMPTQRARTIAIRMAAAAQTVFGKVRAMTDKNPLTVDEIFADSKTRLQALAPYLIGLDMLDQNTALKKDEVKHVFDTLLRIGVDQVSGQGIFAHKELHHEVPYFTLLQNPAMARAFRGVGDLDMLTESANNGVVLKQLTEQIAELSKPKDAGQLFSVVAKEKAKPILGATSESRQLLHPTCPWDARERAQSQATIRRD